MMLRLPFRFPATTLILFVITAASVSCALDQRRTDAEFRQRGVAASNNSHPLAKARNTVLMPGAFTFYFFATVTHSMAWGYVAFVVTILLSYLPVGLLLDWLARRAIAASSRSRRELRR